MLGYSREICDHRISYVWMYIFFVFQVQGIGSHIGMLHILQICMSEILVGVCWMRRGTTMGNIGNQRNEGE